MKNPLSYQSGGRNGTSNFKSSYLEKLFFSLDSHIYRYQFWLDFSYAIKMTADANNNLRNLLKMTAEREIMEFCSKWLASNNTGAVMGLGSKWSQLWIIVEFWLKWPQMRAVMDKSRLKLHGGERALTVSNLHRFWFLFFFFLHKFHTFPEDFLQNIC